MACGCGKRKVAPSSAASMANTIKRLPSDNRVDQAKTFQSATMQAPRGPITSRKTV